LRDATLPHVQLSDHPSVATIREVRVVRGLKLDGEDPARLHDELWTAHDQGELGFQVAKRGFHCPEVRPGPFVRATDARGSGGRIEARRRRRGFACLFIHSCYPPENTPFAAETPCLARTERAEAVAA
jgi:hypothetical protein